MSGAFLKNKNVGIMFYQNVEFWCVFSHIFCDALKRVQSRSSNIGNPKSVPTVKP